jgi:hypothetical protein
MFELIRDQAQRHNWKADMLDVMDQSAELFRRNETKQNNLTAGQHSKKKKSHFCTSKY